MVSRDFCFRLLACALIFAVATGCFAAENGKNMVGGNSDGWSVNFQGGYLYQMDTDIDGGGSFAVHRIFVDGGPSYATDAGNSISLRVGYGWDEYRFSGHEGFAGLKPWEDVNTLRFSLPVRWRFDRSWSLFAAPTLRFTAESGADWGDSLTGGLFAGFSYRVNERLTIGPGFGVLSQLEDSTRFIPVLVVNWKITDTLSLTTGPAVAATLGPGLALNWEPSPKWSFSLGGRAESLRFRLDEDGRVPEGIGDDRSFPVYGGAVYHFTPRIRAGLTGGVALGGKLTLEDRNGHKIAEENYDPAGFFGLTFSARF